MKKRAKDDVENDRQKHEAAPGEAAAEWVEIESLHPWENNPRKNDGEPVAKVVASIRRFGFGSPILARRANGEIIAGHTRWKAAQKLGIKRVPVRFLDLDPADAHLLAVADNRIGEEAKWDNVMLASVLAQLKAEGEDLADTGMRDDELEKLLNTGDAPDQSDDLTASLAVVIECVDEEEQRRVLEWAQQEGLSCRVLI